MSPFRKTAITTALLLGVAVLATGCTRGPSGPNASATAGTTLSPTEAASATPASTPSSATDGCGMTGTVTGGSGPALQVMKAWLKCDTATLRAQLSDPAYAQLTAIGVPKLNMTWSLVRCDGVSGSTYCTYRNKLGSDVIIRLRNEPGPQPVTEFKLDATVYHSDPEKYAREFLDAFVNHNKPRMVALASQSIVDSIVVDAPPAGYNLVLIPEPKWVYDAQFTATGEHWMVTIHGKLGAAHAITAFGNAG